MKNSNSKPLITNVSRTCRASNKTQSSHTVNRQLLVHHDRRNNSGDGYKNTTKMPHQRNNTSHGYKNACNGQIKILHLLPWTRYSKDIVSAAAHLGRPTNSPVVESQFSALLAAVAPKPVEVASGVEAGAAVDALGQGVPVGPAAGPLTSVPARVLQRRKPRTCGLDLLVTWSNPRAVKSRQKNICVHL